MTKTSETSNFDLERLLTARVLDVATTRLIGVPFSSPLLDSRDTSISFPSVESEKAVETINIVPSAGISLPVTHESEKAVEAVNIDSEAGINIHITHESQLRQDINSSNENGGKSNHHIQEVAVRSTEDLNRKIIDPPYFKASTSEEVGELIVRVLERYRITSRKDDVHTWAARPLFLDSVTRSVDEHADICMALPAFPFKSPNKHTKVLGALPDHGEQVALLHLDGMCRAIGDVYKGGAKLYIVSDGLMYNDLLGISDQEVWRYGQALRKRAENIGCQNIRFVRLVDLLQDRSLGEPLSESDYVRDASTIRNEIYRRYMPQSFDVEAYIADDKDAMLTYRGYLKFLEVDLEKHPSISGSMSNAQAKKCQEQVAKDMMRRGKAFANAISGRLSSYIRLSIHSSTEATKLSISLIPQSGNYAMTPWHSSLVRELDGSIQMAHALRVPAKTHELVFDDGRPSYFRELSQLLNWQMEVNFDYLYPCGILISPRDVSAKYSLHNIYMQKVRALAEVCSPVILRGFLDTVDEHTFVAKSYDAGKPLFGSCNNIEARLANRDFQPSRMSLDCNGQSPEAVGQYFNHPARFRYVVALADAPPDAPCSLFASSRLFWQHLPPRHSITNLSKLTWSCKNTGASTNHWTNIPLVVPHPTDASRLCVRWHDAWHHVVSGMPQVDVCIDNGSQYFVSLMDLMLSDRRVCLRMNLRRGDVVLSDNFSTLHNGTAQNGEACSRFWHIDLN